MADISYPTDIRLPRSFEFGLRSNTLVFVSPLTGSSRTIAVPGSRWIASMEWATLTKEQGAQLAALLVRLRGGENRLLLYHLDKPRPLGSAGGTPIVNGAGQTGASISISGLPANQSGVYLRGDMLGIGGELKMVSADAASNGSGIATVSFEPPLRASPANGSSITTEKPTTRFVLNSPEVRWLHVPAQHVDGASIELTEVFS